ncbi:S24 family peptidase [Cupriavidus gilardii]|uniref:S24 family peptidase n=1 Tax=Cupriavidus gilardii TaxID=82541 RepID=A0ABY4VTA6_9BURK|nr:S24 family peptidase [Cupriavidus gilardii]USE79512.1 S24 family peptidase [Cupriavidus gilardii]
MDMNALRRQRLQALVDTETRGNVAEFARRHDLNHARLLQILNPNYRGGRSFGEKVARDLEAALKLPALYLDAPAIAAGAPANIHGETQSETTGQKSPVLSPPLPADKGNVIAWSSEDDLPPDPDRVWIDRYDYHFSAGDGLLQWEVRQKNALPFNLSFFKAKGAKPENCKLLVARGDSMEPYLFNRDVFMVDTTDTHIRDGEIYAVHFEDEALVKQLFKLPGGGIILHSFNDRKYPDRQIPAEKMEWIQIVGRVIYRSG